MGIEPGGVGAGLEQVPQRARARGPSGVAAQLGETVPTLTAMPMLGKCPEGGQAATPSPSERTAFWQEP